MYIFPYNPGSRSARALKGSLGAVLIRHERSRFRGGQRKTVVNWGSSELPEEVSKCRVLNKAERVKVAGNKALTFDVLARNNVSIPDYTRDRNVAIRWIQENRTVVARQSLTGHSGRGIIVMENGNEFQEAPLFVTYIPKSAEYRVHVIGGEIVDIQRKIADPEREVTDWKVRSHQNGFIFIRNREDGQPYMNVAEQSVKDVALQAVRALGLDFAGVDIVWNRKMRRAFCLEANTAIGIEGSTLDVYTQGLKRLAGV